MKKRFAVVVAVVAVVLVVYLLARPRRQGDEWVEGSGVIEATEVDVGPLVGGQLAQVLVGAGDPVKEGQVIAEIARQDLEAQAQQARGALQAAEAEAARAEAALGGARLARGNARTAYEKSTELKGRYEAAQAQHEAALAARDQARARLDLVRAGTRSEQIEQARAGLAGAKATRENAQRELARMERLLTEGAVSQQQVDFQRTAAEAARAAYDAAQARLAEAEAGSRSEEERQAAAALAQAEANVAAAAQNLATAKELYADRLSLRQQLDAAESQYRAGQEAKMAAEGQVEAAQGARAGAEKRLSDATVRAPMGGVVILKIREPGETVAPGQPIVRLADLDHMWLRVNVPETELDRVKLGQGAEVRIDARPGKVYRGRVTEIGQEAEFTPKNVQTRAQRVKLFFPVKVEVENPEQELKPGMPAEARLKTGQRPAGG
jgi:multidrug resistance efflux pump